MSKYFLKPYHKKQKEKKKKITNRAGGVAEVRL
jgi:hypothetical protein